MKLCPLCHVAVPSEVTLCPRCGLYDWPRNRYAPPPLPYKQSVVRPLTVLLLTVLAAVISTYLLAENRPTGLSTAWAAGENRTVHHLRRHHTRFSQYTRLTSRP